ncbi:hypothetical protein JMUB5695_01016 [Mycobacterium heckeshornense]|uniref:Uncharacterized protein n=1 Tax=Mycobacterium heckeshornense TaxID=110505 RepID=A0A7R7TT97_9MYCO|nr:hypothetical protein MHEC_08900 [Mycobacterium heckeshornense]BCQ07595.1 hypothetical protein JMUB5695_01016 [Mycobacterium heckeshornense]
MILSIMKNLLTASGGNSADHLGQWVIEMLTGNALIGEQRKC